MTWRGYARAPLSSQGILQRGPQKTHLLVLPPQVTTSTILRQPHWRHPLITNSHSPLMSWPTWCGMTTMETTPTRSRSLVTLITLMRIPRMWRMVRIQKKAVMSLEWVVQSLEMGSSRCRHQSIMMKMGTTRMMITWIMRIALGIWVWCIKFLCLLCGMNEWTSFQRYRIKMTGKLARLSWQQLNDIEYCCRHGLMITFVFWLEKEMLLYLEYLIPAMFFTSRVHQVICQIIKFRNLDIFLRSCFWVYSCFNLIFFVFYVSYASSFNAFCSSNPPFFKKIKRFFSVITIHSRPLQLHST